VNRVDATSVMSPGQMAPRLSSTNSGGGHTEARTTIDGGGVANVRRPISCPSPSSRTWMRWRASAGTL
jgi:hypothetical protein